MRCLNSIYELDEIIKSAFRKGCLTNNFMLLNSYADYIEQGKLWVRYDEDNVAFLLNKGSFNQLYYYLNDLEKPFSLSTDKPVVMEILYRGHENKPQQLIDYWGKQGFKEHLSRDNMLASWNKLKVTPSNFENIQIRLASSKSEVNFTKELFDNALDLYTGDHLSDSELINYMENKNLLCAYYNNELAGVLQFEIKNKVVWLGHIVIHPDFRGKGIAKALVHSYIAMNKSDENTRYALWVIQNNSPAVNLYRKFGFIYGNKSTVSLLRIT